MIPRNTSDELSEAEVAERMERALKRSFTMGHQPHKPTTLKALKPKTRPASKGRVRKGRSRS
jgi:hypothetical protein